MGAYLAFKSGRDFLRAMDSLLKPADAFPESVGRGTDGDWIVPLSLFGTDPRRVDDGIRLLRVSARRVDDPGKPVTLLRAFEQTWEQRDPVATNWQSPETTATLRAQARSDVKLHSSRTRYLIACSQQNADAVLQSLVGFQTIGVEAQPFIIPEQQVQKLDWEFFWSVRGRPPIAVLRDAVRMGARVWWGPDDQWQYCQFYFEWPYWCPWPQKLLERITWGASGSMILLSPRHPKVVGLEPDGEPLGTLCDNVDLKVDNRAGITKLKKLQGTQKFKVELELVEYPVAQTGYADRIVELELQIAHLKQLSEWLREMARETRPLETGYQPLYVYQDRTGDEDVPIKLQQLMIEWSDQETELGSLYYQRIASRSIDPEAPPGAVSHLLTTGEALGLDQSTVKGVQSLVARLHRYRPDGAGPFSHFVLLPEWEKFGLRLFVPYRDQTGRWKFKMNPVLPETEKSARILADSFQVKWEDRRNWVLVLTPDSNQKVRCQSIPVHDSAHLPGFSRLTKAFQWKCAIDVAPPSGTTLSVYGESAVSALSEAIQAKLYRAFDERVQPLIDRLDQEFEQLRTQFQPLVDNLEANEQTLEDVDRQIEAFEAELTRFLDRLDEVAVHSSRVRNNLESLETILLAGERLRREIGNMEQRLQNLRSGGGRPDAER